MAVDIVIHENTLTNFMNSYSARTEDIKKRATTNFPWTTAVQINMGAPFTTRLGNSAFNSGANLTKAIENVRTNLFGRMQATYTDCYAIYGGITNLKKDTEAVEHLNTLTGEQFSSYIPTNPPPLNPQGSTKGGS